MYRGLHYSFLKIGPSNLVNKMWVCRKRKKKEKQVLISNDLETNAPVAIKNNITKDFYPSSLGFWCS